MKKISLFSFILCACATVYTSKAQDSTLVESPLSISGSVDTYYKYDFSTQNNIGNPGNGTFFGGDQNAISLGMIDVALSKATGKASFVGELSFGPRGQYQSLPTGDEKDGSNSFHIQNLYISFAFSDKFNMTAGYMGTFIGYEVISPVANFNYSTSYLFGAGPFQNAGIKATYTFSDYAAVMVGLFNDWNNYHDLNGLSHIGASLSLHPAEGMTVIFNLLTGSAAPVYSEDLGIYIDAYSSGTIFDVVATYDFSNLFSLGLNAADYSFKSDGGYRGVALYPKVNITPFIGLGLRGECFKIKDADSMEGEALKSLTLSANLKHGGLTCIPELRLDRSKTEGFGFLNEKGVPTNTASQFLLALVYAF